MNIGQGNWTSPFSKTSLTGRITPHSALLFSYSSANSDDIRGRVDQSVAEICSYKWHVGAPTAALVAAAQTSAIALQGVFLPST